LYGSPQIGINVAAGTTGAVIKDNIFQDNGTWEIRSDSTTSGTVSDYNLVYHTVGGSYMAYLAAGVGVDSWSTWLSSSGGDTHSVITSPTMTNPGAGDFTLQVGSPAIGAGVYISGVSTANPPNIGAK
jgi:hypothetical protein